jgi:PAS domain-containing protein
MSHLPIERLAALVDEPPSSVELAHLAACAECARERAAFGTLRAMASAEQARIGVPITQWESLAPVLREDGVIDTGEASRLLVSGSWRARRTRMVGRRWLQAAAAILLVAGGVTLGRLSLGGSAFPVSGGSESATRAASRPTDTTTAFRSVEEARQARARYELLYQSAALYMAEHDSAAYSPDSPAAMRLRLATLDGVAAQVREALNESPYDPVINGYYLTTLGQREATLRQLNTKLPLGVQINRF